MKYIFLICFTSLLLVVAKAQNTDIGQSDFALYNEGNLTPISSINVGETAVLKYSIKNMAITGPNIPANTAKVVISFPKSNGTGTPFLYDGPDSFVSDYFTWNYNHFTEVLVGINNLPIPSNLGDIDLLLRVRGNEAGESNSVLNIRQGNGIEDAIGNNYASAKIIVTSAPLPVKLSEFTAVPNKCDVILTWKTLSEINLNHFDVEYCADGVSYSRVTTLPSKNIVTGSTYTFTFNQTNGNGFYRLKMVDNNGRSYYSDIVRATTSCVGQGSISVFPNPVKTYQKLIVTIGGYEGKKITGELFDVIGQRVQIYSFVNGTNQLNVSKLTTGIYMLDVIVVGNEVKTQTFKIIVSK